MTTKEKEQQTLVSVIIPIYKVEKYLDKCVQSIVSQTHKNLEIILVDDGSTDSCPTMCDEWAKRDTRIKVIHKPNGGLSSARNAGLDIACGDYIMFVDSDDFVENTIVDTLLKTLNEHNADFSMCGAKQVWQNRSSVALSSQKILVLSGSNVVDLCLRKDVAFSTTAWAKLYKKELFENLRFPLNKVHEDEFVATHLICNSSCIALIDLPLYNYVQRKSSIMSTKNNSSHKNAIEAFDQRFELFMQKFPEHEQEIKQYYVNVLKRRYYEIPFSQKTLRKQILKNIKSVKNVKLNFSIKLFKCFPIICDIFGKIKFHFYIKKLRKQNYFD